MPDEQVEYAEFSHHLRVLALRLVRQEASADDVVQEAWLAALEEPAERIRDRDAWLRRVVFNLARRSQRTARRQSEVEFLAADPGPPPLECEVEHTSTSNLLRNSVRSLREPYRTVLTLRYFDELAVKEIAAQVGHSPATVRSQIQRGLRELRGELDRRHAGDRTAWSGILLQVALGDSGSRTAVNAGAAGAAGWGLAHIAILALLVAGVAGAGVWLGVRRIEVPESSSTIVESAGAGSGPPAAFASGETRRPVTGARATPSGAPAANATALSGRSIDLLLLRDDNSPARGGRVRMFGKGSAPLGEFETDGEGRVRIRLPGAERARPLGSGRELGVHFEGRDADQAWSHSHPIFLEGEVESLTLRCLGPAQDLTILVVDESGAPVPSATVMLKGAFSGAGAVGDGKPVGRRTVLYSCDLSGLVRVSGLPRQQHEITVRAPGSATQTRVLAGHESQLEATVRLSPGTAVQGRVRLADGRVAAGARIWQPDEEARLLGSPPKQVYADEHGFFELPGVQPGKRVLFACDANDRTLTASAVVAIDGRSAASWDPVLERRPGVRVRVLDEEGRPFRAALVVLFREAPEAHWVRAIDADEEGRVEFSPVPPGKLGALVKPSRSASQTQPFADLRPGKDEIVLHLSPAGVPSTLKGVLVDWVDAAPIDARLVGGSGVKRFDVPVDPVSGRMHVENLVSGRYELAALVPGLGCRALGEHELAPGTTYDLGIERLAPPVFVDLDWGGVEPSPGEPWALTYSLTTVPYLVVTVRVFEEPLPRIELLPASYRLGPRGQGHDLLEFEVRTKGPNEVVVSGF